MKREEDSPAQANLQLDLLGCVHVSVLKHAFLLSAVDGISTIDCPKA